MSDFELGIAAYDDSNFYEAFEILMRVAKKGHIQAQKIIANMYELGQGVESNTAETIKWYHLAAEQGDVVAQNNLASFLLDENPAEAIKWYILAAEQNFPFAQEVLGDIYSGGLCRSSRVIDYSQAVEWYQKAAEHGFPLACHRLGEMYASGQGVAKNEEEAVKWYQNAARNHYEVSQKILAQAYLEGLLGLPKDPEQAQFWLNKVKINNKAVVEGSG
ncbi:tetratricopeptide repeat protein [Synechocystis sp. PCC 7509]|uniref:tetratricopeptide repeat protein n=1 Tax=Synechocystis sp. PCC 7509 TaxID=927677 RepID=UPI0002AC8D64|nr:tetratricopeptide repeat protein [Synechocystis sp. PCC 7509]